MTDAKVYDFERARKLRDELQAVSADAAPWSRIPGASMVSGGMRFTYSTTSSVGEGLNGQLSLLMDRASDGQH